MEQAECILLGKAVSQLLLLDALAAVERVMAGLEPSPHPKPVLPFFEEDERSSQDVAHIVSVIKEENGNLHPKCIQLMAEIRFLEKSIAAARS